MAFQQRPNNGSLFQNDRKQEDRHPDYTGSALINGVEMQIAGWKKRSSSGKPFLSLSFKPKNQEQQGHYDPHSEPVDPGSKPF